MRGHVFAATVLLACIGMASTANGEEKFLLRYDYPDGKRVIYKNKATVEMDLGGLIGQLLSEYKTTEKLERKRSTDTLNVSVEMWDIGESTMVGSHLIQREVMAALEADPFSFDLETTGKISGFVPPSMKNVVTSEQEALRSAVLNIGIEYSGAYPGLPQEPVGVGDSWTTSSDQTIVLEYPSLEASVLVSSTYYVRKLKRKRGQRYLEIRGESLITSMSYLDFGQIAVNVEGAGTMESKWEFDFDNGRTRKLETKAKINSTATPLSGPMQEPFESKVIVYSKREFQKVE